MNFYNKAFAVYNSILKTFSEDSEFTSIGLIFISQWIHLMFILAIIQKISGILFFYHFSSKYYLLILLVPWFFIVYKFYSKSKIEKIIKEFEEKSNRKRTIWGVVTIASLIIPLSVLFILFVKVK